MSDFIYPTKFAMEKNIQEKPFFKETVDRGDGVSSLINVLL